MASPDCSEEHRHRCEVRQLLRWRTERGRAWVHDFINGAKDERGRQVKGIRQQRGDAAADRILEDCRRQYERGNRGEAGAWES